MRIVLFIFLNSLVLCVMASESWTEASRRIESEQVDLHTQILVDASKLDSKQKTLMLYPGLRKLGYRRSFEGHSPLVDELYQRYKLELMSIPGHATYLSNEIERLIADPANRTTDVRQRRWYIEETLVHLPSPETIWVLGNYLSDERYTPKPGVDNSGGTRQNSYLATTALRRIGLRESDDFIRTKGNRITIRADVDNCLRWWSEVKSGQRPFSFNGENVEYRFNGDGTWEAVVLSESTRRRPAGEGLETKRPEKRFEREDSETSESISARGDWVWLVVPVMFVLWGVIRWRRERNRRGPVF